MPLVRLAWFGELIRRGRLRLRLLVRRLGRLWIGAGIGVVESVMIGGGGVVSVYQDVCTDIQLSSFGFLPVDEEPLRYFQVR